MVQIPDAGRSDTKTPEIVAQLKGVTLGHRPQNFRVGLPVLVRQAVPHGLRVNIGQVRVLLSERVRQRFSRLGASSQHRTALGRPRQSHATRRMRQACPRNGSRPSVHTTRASSSMLRHDGCNPATVTTSTGVSSSDSRSLSSLLRLESVLCLGWTMTRKSWSLWGVSSPRAIDPVSAITLPPLRCAASRIAWRWSRNSLSRRFRVTAYSPTRSGGAGWGATTLSGMQPSPARRSTL